MSTYALLDSDGIVMGYSELSGQVNDPNMVELSPGVDPSPLLGKKYQSGEFVDHPVPELLIELDKTEVSAGQSVTATITVQLGSGVADVNGDYQVPLFDVDGTKKAQLSVNVQNGVGEKNFTMNEPGIYSITMDSIRPKPTAVAKTLPELVVV